MKTVFPLFGVSFFTIVFILLVLQTDPGYAQHHKIVPTDDWAYEYIQRLQNRGLLQELNPTRIPYTTLEIDSALQNIDSGELSPAEQNWVFRLRERFDVDQEMSSSENFRYGISLEAGVRAANSDSLLVLRERDDEFYVYPNATITGYMERGPLIAQAGLRHDVFYDQDPIGIDAVRRLYIRSEDAYLGFQNNYLKVYIGRFQNHWAAPGRASVILSDNARSFDQLNITFGSDKLSMQAILGQLDNMSADSLFTGETPELGAKQRYLAAHRFDWQIAPNFRLTVFESVIYSGTSPSLSMKYLNPLQAFVFTDNAPKNEETNVQIGAAVWMQFLERLTLQTQFMLDDIDIEASGREPTTFSWFTSLDIADAFAGVDIGIEAEAVAYQTYNPEQPEGRYLYLKRGLATQFNDYLYGSIFANIYAEDLRITPRFSWLSQGEQEINQPLVKTNPDGSLIDIIRTGLPEKRMRTSVELFYKPVSSLTASLDVGYTIAEDVNHITGNSENGFSGMLKLKWRLFDLGG